MADGESPNHRRPVPENEPPQKQLKLSVEGGDFQSPRSPAQLSHGNVDAASEAGAAKIIDDNHNEDATTQNLSSAQVIDNVKVDLKDSTSEFRRSPVSESAVAESETREDLHGRLSISNDNKQSVLQASTLVSTDGSYVPKDNLGADLGPGTTAQERTKTSLCSYFRKGGCRHGSACRYAHGEEELRPRPDGSWDPTSERAKALLEKAAAGVSKPVVEASATQAEAAGAREADETTGNPLSKCILNVPRGWSVDQFKNFLTENGINYTTAKKRKGMSVAFVGFQAAEDVEKATKVLNGKTVGKKELVVAESRARSSVAGGPPDQGKSNHDDGAADVTASAGVNGDGCDDGDVGDPELMALSREGPQGEVRNVCSAVTPLAHMSYEEQLNLKRDNIIQVLKRLVGVAAAEKMFLSHLMRVKQVRNTRKGIPNGGVLPEWILRARDKGGLPCALEGVLASPLIDGYRNKCEFTIGCSEAGEKVVGFQVGSFREGMLAVAEPGDCRNVSVIGRSYASLFQEFVQKSELPVWSKKTNSGFWRLLTVREGRAARVEKIDGGTPSEVAEVMLVVQVCPTGIEEERLATEYKRMAEFLSYGANSSSPPIPLTALIVQDHAGISNVFPPDAPLHPLVIQDPNHNLGNQNEYIHEHLNNLRFRISPTAFFQVNTFAAERLYNVAGDWAGLTPDTLLFDVCCGTGTIGLTLAHRVGMVVGIEMNASAVEDAKKNAEVNGIRNCRFVCGKAEDVMDGLLKEYLAPEGTLSERDDTGKSGRVEDSDGVQPSEAGEILETLSDAAPPDIRGDASPSATESHEKETNGPNSSEKLLDQKTSGRNFTNVVAIVDPPRVGLHPTVLKTLRLHGALRRLVYISCNPESMLANAVELCTLTNNSKDEKGKGGQNMRNPWKRMSNVGQARHRAKKMPPSEGFSPVKAIAVDLFPHTDHCEMVMLFER